MNILLRFRVERVAVSDNVRKMYRAIKISELDQHTHRLWWRNGDASRKPDEYVMTFVSFGDKPTGAIAMVALRKTAEL